MENLPLAAEVMIQYHKINKWDRQAKIIEIRQDAYLLKTANDTQLLLGRRFIKLC